MAEAPVDLEQPTSSFHVGTCFANAQKGTYFDGTGFAKAGEVLSFAICFLLNINQGQIFISCLCGSMNIPGILYLIQELKPVEAIKMHLTDECN